jgi:hypothetical protein
MMVSDFPSFRASAFINLADFAARTHILLVFVADPFLSSDDIGVKRIGLGRIDGLFLGSTHAGAKESTKFNVIESLKILNRYEKLF